MHSFTLLSAVTVALIPASHAATYFVAANCEPKYGGITTGSFPEAWAMASNVQAKVDANDAGEAIAYDKLFKGHTPKSDVLGILLSSSYPKKLTDTHRLFQNPRRPNSSIRPLTSRYNLRLRQRRRDHRSLEAHNGRQSTPPRAI
jgi:hypothetical protein